MPEPLQPPSPPTVPVLALPPALADALARMQGTHATAAIKWAAHQAAMADSIAATAAKVEARKQLHAMIDQQFPD